MIFFCFKEMSSLQPTCGQQTQKQKMKLVLSFSSTKLRMLNIYSANLTNINNLQEIRNL